MSCEHTIAWLSQYKKMILIAMPKIHHHFFTCIVWCKGETSTFRDTTVWEEGQSSQGCNMRNRTHMHILITFTNHITVPSRKRAHGRCTLHWSKIGGWADIRGISIVYT